MRWKFLIPSLIVTTAVILFNILLLDTLLKRAAIASGEFIFGARVEIVSFKTRFRDMSVKVRGVSVANKNDVFKNLFEIDKIRFSIDPVHLLSRKFIINEITVAGIKTGTDRKISGALPPRKIRKHDARRRREKETFTGKIISRLKAKGEKELKALPAFSAIKSFEKDIKDISLAQAFTIDELESLKEFENLKVSFADKNEHYKKKISEFKVGDKLALVSAQIKAVSEIKLQSVADIEPAKKTINDLNQTRIELENTYRALTKTREELLSDFGEQTALLTKINELKNKDYEKISQKLKLPQISFDNISKALFGPVWINRVNSALRYIHLARKYMPSRKRDARKMVFTRSKGRDVMFPKEYTPPTFLLRKALLSGAFGHSEPLMFEGVVADITSDPVLHGKPAVIKIEGAKGSRRVALFGQFDHTKEVASDLLRVIYSGLDAKALGLPESEYLPSFEDCLANVSAEIILDGENIESRMNLTILNIRPRSESSDDEVKKFISELWKGIGEIRVDARLYGTKDKLRLEVTSNIDKIISSRLQSLIGDKLAEVQTKLKAEINKMTKQKQEELLKEFNSKKTEAEALYAQKQKELRGAIDLAKSKAAEFEQKAKEQVEREKKKAEEELKRKIREKIPEKLPDIFRR